MAFKLGSKSMLRLSGVNPEILSIVNLAIKITKIDFGIPQDGGLRTAERQNELYVNKSSKADGHVKLSNHQSGNAVDVFAYIDGKASWDELHLAMIAAAMLQSASILGYKLGWGGNFNSFKDMPHFELLDN